MVKASPRVHEVGTAINAREAMMSASRSAFDAVFLDVRMPEIGGLELAGILKAFAKAPALVFVSAFDTPAAAVFELRALDYLLKPVTQERVEDVLERVAAHANAAAAPPSSASPAAPPDAAELRGPAGELLAVHNIRGGGTRFIPRSDILYLQAHGDYLRIYADSGRFILRARLSDLERRLAPHGFVRVHRKYLANLARATELRPLSNGTAVLRFPGGHEIEVARRQTSELRRWLTP